MGLNDRINSFMNGLLGQRTIVQPPGPLKPFDPWSMFVNFNNNTYPLGLNTTLAASQEEAIGTDFGGLVAGAYKSNGIVFACILTRLMIFSEARFQWRTFTKGRPGRLLGNPDLAILEHPWTGATTGDMLAMMLVDADMAGNAFWARRGSRLVRMRPDWVNIVVGSPTDDDIDSWDLDAEVLGYVYYPGGRSSGRPPTVLAPGDVAHFKPIPDPDTRFRGMSWLTPIVREIMADGAASSHKLKYFENAATPNLVIKRPEVLSRDTFVEWVKNMEEGHRGVENAYKSLYLMGGADATVIGSDFRQNDFKIVQGAGETRIAAAAGVHPVIVGLSEGMQGSSLNAGNFGSARRLVADRTVRPLWRNACGSLEQIVPPPDSSSQLWYDEAGIAFLREDRKDAAEIQQLKAATIRQLVDAGYEPETVVAAVDSEDMTLLVHSGLYSVQLQPPNTETTPPIEPAPTNGKVPAVGAKP